MRLSGNTVLVTGGSSGIGEDIAKRLIDLDNKVIVCARSAEKLARLKASNPEMQTRVCDIRSAADVGAIGQELGEQVTLLINSAGIIQDLSFLEDADLAAQIREIDINLNGMLRVLHAFLPGMCRHDEAAIVNVTSATSFVAEARAPIYSATKAAQHALTLALRHQLRKTRVKVFELIPPLTDTPMAAHVEGIPKLPPEKVTDALVRGLARDRLEIAPGLSAVARLMSRIAPNYAFSLLNR